MALPRLADAAGGDEHVGSGARAEIEDRLALVEVGHGGGNSAAERGLDRRPRGRVALLVVEGHAEDLVAVLVGRGDVRSAASDRGRGAAATGPGAFSDRSSGGGVALANPLADVGVGVCVGQLSHADSSSSASGLT